MRKSLLVYLFCSLCYCVYSQSGIVEYKTFFIPNENQGDLAKKIEKEMNLMRFELSYTMKESYFKKLPHIPYENIMANMATVAIGSPFNWYQNPSDKTSYFNQTIKGIEYLVAHDNRMSDWTLTNERKTIEDYVCYKATKQVYIDTSDSYKTITAWYTPEIPVPYGPSGYGGLPGLILEFHHTVALLVANKITINPSKKITYPPANREKVIDPKEQVRIMRASRKVTPD